VSIVIPVRGRTKFMPPLLESIKRIEKDALTIVITIVEHSISPEFQWVIGRDNINYIYLPCMENIPFNKCLAMNVGAMFSSRCNYYLFHDIDLLVNNSFLMNVFANITVNHPLALQTFSKRRVLFCDRELTTLLCSGERTSDDLSVTARGVYDRGKMGAPGGSIFIERDLFFTIGGYDPELWHSYSAEDLFFWDKMNLYTMVGSCDNPVNEVYHLDHPLQQNLNPQFNEMSLRYKRWANITKEEQVKYCEYKSKLINKYK
jgi:predicted glycosyltransferase involved in capsule biosynthesis